MSATAPRLPETKAGSHEGCPANHAIHYPCLTLQFTV
jgi:hypothetical protein